jgi:hypothetical protein
LIAEALLPVVIDGDGIFAVASSTDGAGRCCGSGPHPTVITPHDGEYALLTGGPPGADRVAATRGLAADLDAVVLLKGPTTVIADAAGAVLVVDHGDERLATAGSGDVLTGMIASLLAAGVEPLSAAAGAAWLHADAARRGPSRGLLAGDIVDLVPLGAGGTDRTVSALDAGSNGRWAWAEVDLDAVRHNVRVLRLAVAPSEVWAVVKANGYGHGAVDVATAALDAGAQGLCVALVHEGVELRAAGIDAPILVLSEQPAALADDIVRYRLMATVYSPAFVAALADAAAERNVSGVPIHLKLDTGMQRVGARPDAVGEVVERSTAAPTLRLVGVFTHLAMADEPDDEFTAIQLARFDDALAALTVTGAIEAAGLLVHAANSAGALAHPAARRSFVRAGIASTGSRPDTVSTICAATCVRRWH